jgi:hypothetical protein
MNDPRAEFLLKALQDAMRDLLDGKQPMLVAKAINTALEDHAKSINVPSRNN